MQGQDATKDEPGLRLQDHPCAPAFETIRREITEDDVGYRGYFVSGAKQCLLEILLSATWHGARGLRGRSAPAGHLASVGSQGIWGARGRG